MIKLLRPNRNEPGKDKSSTKESSNLAMHITGQRKCLLVSSLVFLVCLFCLKSGIRRSQVDFYLESASPSSGVNVSSSDHSIRSPVGHVIRRSATEVAAKVTAKVATKVTADDRCVRDFLSEYSKYCENRLTKPRHLRPGVASLLCPCIPSYLGGLYSQYTL